MSLKNSLNQLKLRERRLQFIRTHQQAFDVQPAFPLPLFEEVVLEIEGSCGIESSCKVEGDRLLAGRFEVCNDFGRTWPESFNHALKLLDGIESQVGIDIDRNLFEQFSLEYINSSKIINNTVGIHLGSRLEDSSATLYFHLDVEQDPEELVRTALLLGEMHYSNEITEVLIRDTILIGFELFFDGRGYISLWAGALPPPSTEMKSRGKYCTAYIQKYFSQKAIALFRKSSLCSLIFSKNNLKPLLAFSFINVKDIPKYFSFNSTGNRVYSFCQNQSCITDIVIAATESELEKSRLENFCFYYNQSDQCGIGTNLDFD